MLTMNLTDNESRVIGCLMEKSITTPDQYPLTLNALTNACNQKSARAPVMSLSQGTVQHTVRELERKHLLRVEENFKRGVEKYTQRICNSSFSELQFDPAEFALVCLLLLRGPQTPGELRANGGRLHEFTDNNAVLAALEGLIQYASGALVVKLPRTPGRKDSEYMHLFSGEVDLAAHAQKVEAAQTSVNSPRGSMAQQEQRVSGLEADVAEVNKRLA